MADGQLTAKVGNVTRVDALRYTPQGKAVLKVGIAVNPYAPQGQPKPDAQFYDVVLWGSLGENTAQWLKKGQRIVVVGKGELKTWTGKDGMEKSAKEITADGFGPDGRFATFEVKATERNASPAYAKGEEEF